MLRHAKKLLQMHQQLTDAAAAIAVAVAAAVAATSTCCCRCPEAATAAIRCTSIVDSFQADARKLQKQLVNSTMGAELDDKKEQLAEAQAAAESASADTKLMSVSAFLLIDCAGSPRLRISNCSHCPSTKHDMDSISNHSTTITNTAKLAL